MLRQNRPTRPSSITRLVGEIADGTRIRNNDRLSFSGRVVYQGSNTPVPRDIGILVEVFDGELIWSDGSLGDSGEFMVEVPLSSAQSLQSSPSRTCLISITNIPGEGEDMSNPHIQNCFSGVVTPGKRPSLAGSAGP